MIKSKIAMYDLEGNLLEVFETNSIVNLEKILKLPKTSLNGCLSGRLNKTNNRQFRMVTGNIILNKIGDISNLNSTNVDKSVIKFYKGKFICSYPNQLDAAQKTGVEYTNLSRCLNNKQKTAGGYEWVYSDSVKLNKL